MLSFRVTALGHLPGLFSDGLNFPFRALPRSHVLVQNLPDFLLLEPFSVPR